MGTVDVFTAARSQAIEDAAIVDGYINGSGHLILVQHNGTEIDAGDALLAVPPASTSQAGYVELATTAEADAHTDAERAVTPASLVNYDARLDALEVDSGTTVKMLAANSILETATPPAAYPLGISMLNIDSPIPAWSPAQYGLVITYRYGPYRNVQYFHQDPASGNNVWIRGYHSVSGWTAWTRLATPADSSTMGITGEIKMWSAASAPTGWMLCEGGAISRTTYAALFALLGTNYGAGDGSTTFNVPDMRGRVPVGFDTTQTEFNTRGKTGGEKTHVLTTAEMPSHNHQVGVDTSNGWASSHPQALTKGASGFVAGTGSDRPANSYAASAMLQATGGGGAHNVLQPYMTVKYIIKL
jgi:microcystin-dependent protein